MIKQKSAASPFDWNYAKLLSILKDHYGSLLLFVILVLGIFLRVTYFQGIDFDGAMYVLHAKHIDAGVYDIFNLGPYGQGVWFTIIIPLLVIIKVFGVSEWSVVSFVFLCSLLQIVICYYLGYRMFNVPTGLIAAILLAIFPLDVNTATVLEGDIIISFFITTSFFLYYIAVQNNKRDFIFLSGILIGISLFVKMFTFFFFVFLILYELFIIKNMRETLKRSLLFMLGFLVAITPYLLFFFIKTGNPFYFYVVQNEAQTRLLSSDIFDIDYYPSNILLIQHVHEPPMLSIYFLLFFALAFYYIFKKRIKETSILLLWCIPLFLILEFVPFLPKTQRYLILIESPVILLIAKGIYDFSTSSIKKYLKVGIIVVLAIALICIGYTQYQAYHIFTGGVTFKGQDIPHEEKAVAVSLSQLPKKNLYITHYNQIPLLNFFMNYSKNSSTLYGYRGATETSIYDLHYVQDLNEIHDSYLLLDKRILKQDSDPFGWYAETNGTLEWFEVSEVPSTWHVILGIGNETTTHTALFYVE